MKNNINQCSTGILYRVSILTFNNHNKQSNFTFNISYYKY